MKRPRLLLLNWRDMKNPEAGGAEVHLQEVARRLVADGFVCIQYSHAFPGGKDRENIEGVQVIRQGSKLLFNFTVWKNLRRWVREHQIDVVLDDSNKIPFLAPLLSPVPVVAQIHHLFGRVVFKETAWPMALYVLAFEKLMPWVYRNVQVYTGSASSQSELRSKGFKRVNIAVEGVDLQLYQVPANNQKKPRQILYVGRIKRYKKLEIILEALALVQKKWPEAYLLIAGSGDDTPRLKALAQSKGMASSVKFLGFVTETQKVHLYAESAVVVNSSLKEGWGLTSIEANACGTPVVATNVPGLCDSVRHGETGLLVPFGDARTFAQALEKILAGDNFTQTMIEAGLNWAHQHTWEPAYTATREGILQAYGEKSKGAKSVD